LQISHFDASANASSEEVITLSVPASLFAWTINVVIFRINAQFCPLNQDETEFLCQNNPDKRNTKTKYHTNAVLATGWLARDPVAKPPFQAWI